MPGTYTQQSKAPQGWEDHAGCPAEAAAASERRGVRHSTLSQHNVAAAAAAAAREVVGTAAASPVASRAGSATSQRSCISTHSHGGGHITFAATVTERTSLREVRRQPYMPDLSSLAKADFCWGL